MHTTLDYITAMTPLVTALAGLIAALRRRR